MQLKVKTLAMCLSLALGTTVLTACSSVNTTDASNSVAAISLETQGSFAIGGSYITHDGTFSKDNFLDPAGQKAYGDHAYVFYQIPTQAHELPIVFQHGGAQTKRTWESTPDGRDGFQNMFLKDHFAVYLVDHPRMGEAGLSTVPASTANPWARSPMFYSETFFDLCRLGDENGLYAGSQFPAGEANIEAFQRSWNQYSGELDDNLNAQALGKLLTEKTGPAILMTHSMGGTIGWRTPWFTSNVKAIVAIEPGGTPFVFPEGYAPQDITTIFKPLVATAFEVPMEKFKPLTQIPILLVYGDYIPSEQVADPGQDKWRSELEMARAFVKTVNDLGGNAQLLHLPELGIHGNTHFLMAEKNNQEIFSLIRQWISQQGLDQ